MLNYICSSLLIRIFLLGSTVWTITSTRAHFQASYSKTLLRTFKIQDNFLRLEMLKPKKLLNVDDTLIMENDYLVLVILQCIHCKDKVKNTEKNYGFKLLVH